MSNGNIVVKTWSPSSDMAQSCGSDGTNAEGDEVLRWSKFVGAALNDGQGNEISMTEAIQLLIALKNQR